jgi:hypothetical protein
MNIKVESIDLMKAIHSKDYYVSTFYKTLGKYNMSVASIDQSKHTDEQLVSMWNSFWMALPDSTSIRREPFFKLCGICEEIYD